MAAYFNIFLIVMALLALAVYIALHYFEAGYGYLFNRKYGFPIPNRIGWVLMECPVFIAMTVLWIVPWLGVVLLVLGAALAWVRVIGGVHCPRGVLVGAAVGILAGVIGFYVI